LPARVALITPAPLTRLFGDSLRPLMQARGLWDIGWRDFVIFTAEPDPSLPFEQVKITPRGPLQLIQNFNHGCQIAHAHQNSGLFLKGRVWTDLHGYAPLESSLALKAQPGFRRSVHYIFSRWATRRLVARAERILCASDSIMRNVINGLHPHAPINVLQNTINPDDYPATTGNHSAILVIGGFTTRWGRTSFPIALETARQAPELQFRFIGAIDENQIAAAQRIPNIEILNHLDMTGYQRGLRESAIALIPFADWCRGGGPRQKIIQAAASALAIVATPPALEGIEDDTNFFLATTPAALVNHLRHLASDPNERQTVAQNLRQRFTQQHDYRAESQKLAELYESALRK
jgi:glycosyltransferase involved in cell wall biosynthesis